MNSPSRDLIETMSTYNTKHGYGTAPVDLGLIEIDHFEQMSWLYCPIKLPGRFYTEIPDNLLTFRPLIIRIKRDYIDRFGHNKWFDQYIYLTVKCLWTDQSNIWNRPGWHSDGFMTSDINYIWSDSNPTLFWEPNYLTSIEQDHNRSMIEMRNKVLDSSTNTECKISVYPNKHLLRLDEFVIHSVNSEIEPGYRTFVKVSISESEYALEGNSINHLLGPFPKYHPRTLTRNSPEAKSGNA